MSKRKDIGFIMAVFASAIAEEVIQQFSSTLTGRAREMRIHAIAERYSDIIAAIAEGVPTPEQIKAAMNTTDREQAIDGAARKVLDAIGGAST